MFLNIVTLSTYDDIFVVDFVIVVTIIIWYYHPVTADVVPSSLIEAADGYRSCFCSLLAHTCQWQCHCWPPRRSQRQQRQRHRSSAAATAREPRAHSKEPCTQPWAATSPAPATTSSYVCHLGAMGALWSHHVSLKLHLAAFKDMELISCKVFPLASLNNLF